MPNKTYIYKNLDIDINGEILPIIVCGIWAGLLVGVIISLVCRSFTGGLIHRLKNAQASDRDSAKTLSELNTKHLWLASVMLGENSSMFRYVKVANREDAAVSSKSALGKLWNKIAGRHLDWRQAKLYLPEDERIAAESRYVYEKHPVRSFVIAAVLLTAGAVFTAYALPELLLMLDNLLSMSK